MRAEKAKEVAAAEANAVTMAEEAMRERLEPAKPEPVRVGDFQRHAIVDKLSEYYTFGYITLEEFQVRSDQALAATCQSDLDGLLSELPGLLAKPPVTITHLPDKKDTDRAFRVLFCTTAILTYLVIVLAILVFG